MRRRREVVALGMEEEDKEDLVKKWDWRVRFGMWQGC